MNENKNNQTEFVTYLLGAGASAKEEALPLVKDFNIRLTKFKNEISPYVKRETVEEKPIRREIIHSSHQFLDDLDWLIENAEKHASIDTFAKKLFVTKKDVLLQKLKKTLSIFFIFEQIEKQDPRYDSFISAIISRSKILDERVRIISWNYDYQLEKALAQYLEISDLNKIQGYLGASPSQFFSEQYDHSNSRVIKVNGTTTFENTINVKGSVFENLIPNLDANINDIDFYNTINYALQKPLKSLIKFAWESNLSFYDRVIKQFAEKSIALVVIGYSFPFFNREIDRIFFQYFKGNHIYIQDLNPEGIADSLKSVFPLGKKNDFNIVKISNIDQFFLPPEL